MESENAKENGAKIFCIYFQNKESKFDFGDIKGNSLEMLNEIAKLGGTNEVCDCDTLSSLCNTFFKINEAIETNYRLKLNK